MELTEEEVLEILRLIEESSFDYFQLELGDLKLTVGRGGAASGSSPHMASKPACDALVPAMGELETPPGKPASAARMKDRAGWDGLTPVEASMVGTFHAAPDPESPPFVEVGARVEEDTTVGLIEVMKVFTGVRAGVRGVVKEVLVANAQFVEYGQAIFLIEPDPSSE